MDGKLKLHAFEICFKKNIHNFILLDFLLSSVHQIKMMVKICKKKIIFININLTFINKITIRNKFINFMKNFFSA